MKSGHNWLLDMTYQQYVENQWNTRQQDFNNENDKHSRYLDIISKYELQ